MYNKVILSGNLTRDIELKHTPSGLTIANTGIATNRKFKTQTGEQKEEVMFIDLTFFGRTAEIAHQYLRKGSRVMIDGRLVLQQWTAQDGSKRSKHSITVETLQMLRGEESSMMQPPKTENRPAHTELSGGSYAQPQPSNSGEFNQPSPPSQNRTIPEIDIDEDEIPF